MSSVSKSNEQEEQVLAKQAKKASLVLGALSLEQRNLALEKIYDVLIQNKDEILEANRKDMEVLPLLSLVSLVCNV